MIETFVSNQILFFLLIMAVTAIFAGFFAGFFGIGGGIITVPCLFYIFGSLGVDQSFIMHLAVGTSFAIIIPTAAVKTASHITLGFKRAYKSLKELFTIGSTFPKVFN